MTSKTKINTIHQFTPSMALGDSVSNAVLYIQKLLINFGFKSNIYVSRGDLDLNFKHDIAHIDEYNHAEEKILLYHHSIGHSKHDEIMMFKDKKIMIYHNITPAHFFKNKPYIQNLTILGREQLSSSAKFFIAAIGDSSYNCKELKYYNYKNVTVLTLLLDLDKQIKFKVNQNIIKKYQEFFNIIFVGRVVQNKAQHQLLDVAYALKNKGIENFKIHIIGGASEPLYMNYLQEYAKSLNILDVVSIKGKISDEALASYYTLADLYLSLSEHEGFGMPLVEAMKYDVPVIAYNTGGINTSLPEESLVEKKSPSFIAGEIIKLQNNPYKRVYLIKKQREKLSNFSNEQTKNKFALYLNKTLHTDIKIDEKKIKQKKSNYEIQGPFDSTYSLAIVNKSIANALQNQTKYNVKLYSTEGDGDFEPKLKSLDKATKSLALKKMQNVDITIRNLYPPRTNAMQGYHKIFGPYGWEESKFPTKYVEWFNTKLTIIFAMSNYVKNTLKDNGILIPIYTVGLIVEDILSAKASPLLFELPKGFKLLHISSCFPRKGVDVLLDAFDALADESISLIIKTFPNPHNKTIKYLERLDYVLEKQYEKNVYLYTKTNKEILLINKDISQNQIKYLYENADALVAPSFGEGFGLPNAEAMLLNLPVITTAYSGQTDFCTKNSSWLIDFDFEYAKTHMMLDNSVWVKPKVTSLIEQILLVQKEAESNTKKYKNKLEKAKQIILKKYSSKNVVAKIEHSIQSYPVTKPVQNIALFSSFNSKCGIAIYAKYLISSFEDEVIVLANDTDDKTAKDTSNILRCWKASRDTHDISDIKKHLKSKSITTLIIQYNFSFLPLETLGELLEFCKKNDIKTHLFLHSTQDVVTNLYVDSFKTIKTQMRKATKIYMHTLKDLNYLKSLGIFQNTFLTTHGINTKLTITQNTIKNKNPTLATFGFLLPHKGILELIDVTSKLHQKGLKVNLLLLTSLHTAPISKILLNQLKEKINRFKLSKYITLITKFLSEDEIVSKLSQVDKIIFNYQNTQESSSAAVRVGLLAKKEVITTPLDIFEDVDSIVTKTDAISVDELVKTIQLSLCKVYDTKKHTRFLEKNSWDTISKCFYNSIS